MFNILGRLRQRRGGRKVSFMGGGGGRRGVLDQVLKYLIIKLVP